MKKVILSTSMLLECGTFEMKEVSLEEAKNFAKTAENFVGHSTVRILGIEPTTERKTCTSYDEALVIKVNKRLEFGKEYSIQEIENIGYKIYKIKRLS